MRAFISAGHQERPGRPDDPGAIVGDYREDEFAARIANGIALAMGTVQPILIPQARLSEKIEWVNRWSRPGDVAIEVHLNAGSPAAYGCEVFYSSDRSRHLAAELHASLVKIGRSPRGVKIDSNSARGRLAWCRKTKPWAALVEVAFLSNEYERGWLLNGGCDEAAVALASALDRWA